MPLTVLLRCSVSLLTCAALTVLLSRAALTAVEVLHLTGHVMQSRHVTGHPVEVRCLADRAVEVLCLLALLVEMRCLTDHPVEMHRLADCAVGVPHSADHSVEAYHLVGHRVETRRLTAEVLRPVPPSVEVCRIANCDVPCLPLGVRVLRFRCGLLLGPC